jgi:hypothetical protein
VPALEHSDLFSGARQVIGRHQSAVPSAYDDRVVLICFDERFPLRAESRRKALIEKMHTGYLPAFDGLDR